MDTGVARRRMQTTTGCFLSPLCSIKHKNGFKLEMHMENNDNLGTELIVYAMRPVVWHLGERNAKVKVFLRKSDISRHPKRREENSVPLKASVRISWRNLRIMPVCSVIG